jgi:hypothetical protein
MHTMQCVLSELKTELLLVDRTMAPVLIARIPMISAYVGDLEVESTAQVLSPNTFAVDIGNLKGHGGALLGCCVACWL